MSNNHSVTLWLHRLRQDDSLAAQKLWEAYFSRLVGLARAKLRNIPRPAADEEDVALSAFDSFFRGVKQGRFPRLEDRDDLWQILLMITERKAYDLLEHDGRAKRDWRKTKAVDLAEMELIGQEPDPAFAAQVAEECERLLAMLNDDKKRAVAICKLEGFTNQEIAAKVGKALPTIERWLRMIRREWKAAAEAQDSANK